jgi:hypothetical protein
MKLGTVSNVRLLTAKLARQIHKFHTDVLIVLTLMLCCLRDHAPAQRVRGLIRMASVDSA